MRMLQSSSSQSTICGTTYYLWQPRIPDSFFFRQFRWILPQKKTRSRSQLMNWPIVCTAMVKVKCPDTIKLRMQWCCLRPDPWISFLFCVQFRSAGRTSATCWGGKPALRPRHGVDAFTPSGGEIVGRIRAWRATRRKEPKPAAQGTKVGANSWGHTFASWSGKIAGRTRWEEALGEMPGERGQEPGASGNEGRSEFSQKR